MIAYQIVIKGDERSEEYARLSRESFQPLLDSGHLSEIRVYDAITPSSEDFEGQINMYSWSTSLMVADWTAHRPDDHSPTEKAGMCSHWDLLRICHEMDERIMVLEHDSYLLDTRVDMMMDLLDMVEEYDVYYANVGLFMGCYMLRPHTAGWFYEILRHGNDFGNRFPINCGPYCTMQRLFRTYTTHYLKKNGYDNIEDGVPTVIHPWHHCDTLYMGRRVDIPFNNFDGNRDTNIWRTPSTQLISKRLSVTQEHWGYKDHFQTEPWLRHNFFKVID